MKNNSKVFYSPQIKKILTFMSKYHKEYEAYPKLNEIGKSLVFPTKDRGTFKTS